MSVATRTSPASTHQEASAVPVTDRSPRRAKNGKSKAGRPDLASRHLRVDYPDDSPRPETQFFGVEGAAGLSVVFVFLRNATDNPHFIFAIDVLLASTAFIVTWIMLRRLDRPFSALERTYDSRIKHTFPGLLLLVMVTLAMVNIYGTFNEFGSTLLTGAAGLLGLANYELVAVHAVTATGPGEMNALYHLWAVSVMLQFFAVWPLLMAVVSRLTRNSINWLIGISVAVFVGSALVIPMQWVNFSDRVLGFTAGSAFLPMMAGSIAAMIRYRYELAHMRPITAAKLRHRPWLYVLATGASAAMMALLLAMSFDEYWFNSARLYPAGFAIVSVAIGALLLTLTSRRNLLKKVFSFSLFAGLGKMSFIIYLVHYPVLWFFRAVLPLSGEDWITALVAGVVTLMIALVTYLFLLVPGKETKWKSSVVVPVVTATLALLAYWLRPYVALIVDSVGPLS